MEDDTLEVADVSEQTQNMLARIDLLNLEVQELQTKLEETENEKTASDKIHRSEMTALLERNETLKKSLDETVHKLQLIQREKQEADAELLDLRARANYDDTETLEEANLSEYQYVSLCEVSAPDFKNTRWLFRIADINRQGQIEAFYADEDKPKYFANRERLFWRDGPSEEGTVGVWSWNATPNNTDPSKDYIFTAFNKMVMPVEEIIIPDCKNSSELIEKLKEGVVVETSAPRVVFAAYLGKGNFVGFLCRSKELEKESSKLKLHKSLVSLPKYEFESKDVIQLSNGKYYFRNVTLGMPAEVVHVKDPLEIVRNVVVSRNTWKVFKDKGKTKSEWRTVVQDFLGGMDTKSIAEEVAEASNCSLLEAKKMLDEFIVHANSYMDGSSFEDSIILSVINDNQDLMERCKALIYEDWREENKREVDEAYNNLQTLKKQLDETQSKIKEEISEGKIRIDRQNKDAEEQLAIIKTEHDSLAVELQGLKDHIEEQKQLAVDVENEVSQKISEAKENVAGFIANMAFVTSSIEAQASQASLESAANNIVVENNSIPLPTYTKGSVLEVEEFESLCNVDEVVDLIMEELRDAGVIERYARSFASFLYSAFSAKAPLLLIGPNASCIADAVSIALFGKTAGVIECEGVYNKNIITECSRGEDTIVKILNPFNANWVLRVPEIVNSQDVFFFAIHPYSEDVQIEPKSLYNYILPVFTEPIVENRPVEFKLGGHLSSDFKALGSVKTTAGNDKILKEMHMSPLLRGRIRSVLSTMHSILKDKSQDYDVLYVLLPYAYATMQLSIFAKAVQDNESKDLVITKNMKDLIDDFVGELE